MKTASWFTFKGDGRIGISLGNPRGQAGGYKLYRPLNPPRHILHSPRSVYEPVYRAMLDSLDPHRVWADVHNLAAGAEPVLLCFERPPFTVENWCHRRMVADWIQDNLGHEVPEFDPKAGVVKQPGLF